METTIRKRIGDSPKTEIELFEGNGVITTFDIHNTGAYMFEITNNDVLVPDTEYTYDIDIQKVLFDTAPDEGAIISIKYKHAAFTDADLTQIYADAGNDIDRATAESLRQILGDQAKMVSFQRGDRSVSMSDIFNNMMKLLNSYESRITNSGANSGSSFEIGTRIMTDDLHPNRRPSDLSRLIGYEE